jgi:hypothetical protein
MYAALTMPEIHLEVNSKVKIFISMAPVTYFANPVDPIFRISGYIVNELSAIANLLGMYQLGTPDCIGQSHFIA